MAALLHSCCWLKVYLRVSVQLSARQRWRQYKQGSEKEKKKTPGLQWDSRSATSGRIITRSNYKLIHEWHVSLRYRLKCLQHRYLLKHDVIRPRCNTQGFCSDLRGNIHHVCRCNNQEEDSSGTMFASSVVPRSSDMTQAEQRENSLWSLCADVMMAEMLINARSPCY